MPRPIPAVLTILLATAALPLAAADTPWPVRYRQDLARLTEIEWRMRDATGHSCPLHAADVGFALDDRRAYPRQDWPLLAQTLGMKDRPVIAAIAAGSPAGRAGLLPGDEIDTIAGQDVEVIAQRRKAGALVAEALLDEIAAQPAGQPLRIGIRRGGAASMIEVVPKQHCAARLVLVSDRSVDAHSDTRNVAISTGLVTFARNDDELALAAGHELAHIIHGDRRGGGIAKRRAMEDAADSLGLRLMRCAGYDGTRGAALFEHLGARDWLGFLRAPTHRSFKARFERLLGEADEPVCPPT